MITELYTWALAHKVAPAIVWEPVDLFIVVIGAQYAIGLTIAVALAAWCYRKRRN